MTFTPFTLFAQSSFCLRLTETFAHFLWQGTLIALLIAAITPILRKKSPHVRYAVLLSALLLMAACPPASFFLLTSPAAEMTATPINLSSIDTHIIQPSLEPSSNTPLAIKPLPKADIQPATPPADKSAPFHWQRYTPYAATAYFAGVLVMLVRLLLGLYGGQKLRRVSEPVDDPNILTALARQAKLLGLAFTPAVAYCHEILVPTVVGLLRPMVLLPLSLTTGLTIDQIEVILAHELAHLRRYDHLVNIVQRLIEAFLFFHPAVWYLSRLVRVERELCCDDCVLAAGGKPTTYAASLVHVAELCLKSKSNIPNAAALGLADRSSNLRRRILRLLGSTGHEQIRLTRTWAFALGLVLLLSTTMLVSSTSQKAKAENKKSNETTFTGTLPNEVKVELIGVSYHPSKNKPWWRPDGSPLSNAPYAHASGNIIPQKNEEAREFAVRIINPSNIDFRTRWKFIPGCSFAGNSVMDKSGRYLQEVTAVAAAVPKDRTGITLEFGVAAGPWETIAQSDGKGELSSSRELGGITFTQAYEITGVTKITVADDIIERDCRIVAVDKKGKIHTSNGSPTGSTSKIRQTTGQFPNLPLTEIKEFQFQTRPYHWVTFKNIALEPDKKTTVQIESPQNIQNETSTKKILLDIKNSYEKTQNEFRNIELVASSRQYKWSAKKNDWEPIPARTHVRAWYENGLQGNLRVEFDPQILEWSNGAAPYCETRWLMAYDGTEYRKFDFVYSDTAKLYSPRLSEKRNLYGNKRVLTTGNYATGVENISINNEGIFRLIWDGINYYEKDPLFRKHVRIKKYKENNQPFVAVEEIGNSPQDIQTRTVLDPGKNYSLVGKKVFNTKRKPGQPECVSEVKVLAWKNIGSDLWFPSTVVWLRPFTDMNIYQLQAIGSYDPADAKIIFTAGDIDIGSSSPQMPVGPLHSIKDAGFQEPVNPSIPQKPIDGHKPVTNLSSPQDKTDQTPSQLEARQANIKTQVETLSELLAQAMTEKGQAQSFYDMYNQPGAMERMAETPEMRQMVEADSLVRDYTQMMADLRINLGLVREKSPNNQDVRDVEKRIKTVEQEMNKRKRQATSDIYRDMRERTKVQLDTVTSQVIGLQNRLAEARAELAKLAEQTTKQSTASISPAQRNVVVLGLTRSGIFSLPENRNLSLPQIIAAADGIPEENKNNFLNLLRTDGQGRLKPVWSGKAETVFTQKDSAPILKPGDIVCVTKEKILPPAKVNSNPQKEIYVFGDVPRPGAYAHPATLLEALVAAGFNPEDHPESVVSLYYQIPTDSRQIIEGINPIKILRGQTPDISLRIGVVVNVSTHPTPATTQKNNSYSIVVPFSGLALVRGAQSTITHYTEKEKNTGETGIPSDYWAEPIRELNPIKVYTHRVNLVVVRKNTETGEKGLYITIPISSYIPRNNDDGFVFKKIGENIYHFEKSLAKNIPSRTSSPSTKAPVQILIQATVLSVPADTDLSFLKNFEKNPQVSPYRIHLSPKQAEEFLARVKTIKNMKNISSPQILVRERQTATIQIGEKPRVPMPAGGHKNVGFDLSVTPELNPQGGCTIAVKSTLIQPDSASSPTLLEYSAEVNAQLPADTSLLVQFPVDKAVRLVLDEKGSGFKKEEIKKPQKSTEFIFLLLKPTVISNPPQPVASDEILGKVLDPAGHPVPEAVVTFFPRYDPHYFPDAAKRNLPVLHTDTEGVFRLPHFPGYYTYVQIDAPGFASAVITDLIVGRIFTVNLENKTRVKGAFIKPDGTPTGPCTISLIYTKHTARPAMSNQIEEIRLERKTDRKGEFDFPVEPATYDIQVVSDSGFFARFPQYTVKPGKVVILSAKLQPGVTFETRAVDSQTGQPVVDQTIYIQYFPQPGFIIPLPGSERTTDKDGRIIWKGLMPGQTALAFTPRSYQRWWSDQSENGNSGRTETYHIGIDNLRFNLRPGAKPVVITMEKGIKISGRVLSPDGTPVFHALIDINSTASPGSLTNDARYMLKTDEKGRFEGYFPVGKNLPLNLCVWDSKHRWANAVTNTFMTKPGDDFNFTLEMTKGGTLRGRVVGPNGQPVSNFKLIAINQDNRETYYAYPRATTTANGHFTFPAIRPGRYLVEPDETQGREINGVHSPTVLAIVAESQPSTAKDLTLSTDYIRTFNLKLPDKK